mgnify:FL=1
MEFENFNQFYLDLKMSKTKGKLIIIVGAIGFIVLACLNWLIVVGLLFLALIICLASNDINNGDSRYTSKRGSLQKGEAYMATGSRTKSRFNFTYEQMKELGLETLVNRWFAYRTRDIRGTRT